jgi:ATP-dependent RNA helicase SUPV3L1/SUV3
MNIRPKHTDPLVLSGRDVTAVLGPTNTGKTHLAIERMVAHESGVIGLPLRLLAREVYQRVCEKVGANKVALITGEEKIAPVTAKYSVCTVEAMPRETDAAFVAIDEVQLAGDLERGHIFTDRLLHLRGRQETLLLGAATMRGIVEKLLKGVSVVTRPRLSHLAYAGSKKLTRLPRRTAIVAFSADEVYAIAELIRRQRGGAAVVLGALSPRTRNAQVALYQSGDVDYLVATDAIGMGLNLDVDHVAFAQNRKFDGYQFRDLNAGELGQIAGRAGRHLRDGTFGVTGQVDPLSDELIERIEGHQFDPVKVLQWRTAQFDFASLEALKHSIDTPAPVEGLARALPAVDAQALEHLSREAAIRDLADRPQRVALLWEVCALPDYRKIAPAQHSDLIASIFTDLARRGHVDENYMADQVRRAESADGDIDALSHRIAQIRTWTFVSNRPGWLADPAHWREKTREIEDRLSDALHERLTKRFVDRRTSVLMRRVRENTMLEAEISPSGAVLVESHHVGELQGFRFTPDQSAGGEDGKAIRVAAQKALAAEFEARAERFSASGNHDIALGSDGLLRWLGAPVATLAAAEDALRPRIILLADEQLTGPARDKVVARAERYVHFQIESQLKPLADLVGAGQIGGMARGIAFRLVENLGLINRRDIAEDVKALDQESRAALRRLGVRFGAYHIFVPALLKPAPAGLLTLLWALKNDAKELPGFGDVVHALASGRTSVVVDPTFDKSFYKLAGYRMLGRRAVRVDILERLADLIRPALAWKPGVGARPDGGFDGRAFVVTPQMMSILGATADDIEEILKGLGYRGEPRPAAQVRAQLADIDAAHKAALAKAEADRAAAKAAADAAAAEQAVQAESAAADNAAEDVAAESVAETVEVVSETVVPEDEAATEVLAEPEHVEEVAAEVDVSVDSHIETTVEAEPVAVEELVAEGSSEAEASSAQVTVGEAVAEAAPAVASADVAEAVASEAVETASVAADGVAKAEPPVEEKPILLWRPARFERRPEHRPDHRRRGAPGGQREGGYAGQPGQREGGQPGQREGNQPGQREGGRRDHRRPERASADQSAPPAQVAGAEARADGRQRFDKKFHGKPNRPDGDARGEHRGDRRPDRHGKGEGPQKPSQPPRQPREEKPARYDPDSPFAKLAALRDKLTK